MYKIIGGDQKEYGPVTTEQLVGWIRDHRANAQTLVAKEGGPWVPLGSLPEFAEHLGPSAGPVVPESSEPTPGAGTGSTPLAMSGGGPSRPWAGGGGLGGGGVGPGGGFGGLGGGGDARAREMVSGPATALMVSGILFVIFALIGLVGNMMGASFRPPPGEIPPEMQQFFQMMEQMQGPVAIVSGLLQLGVSGLLIFASQKLRALESFGLVVTATILAMVPCTSPCCCLGLPVGIWILVVLFKPEVKSAFR
jgi:hypothetical protein